MQFPPVRGVIFDLDGTLVDSGLDFDHMRREMRLPPGQPILEAISQLPADESLRCWEILSRHEREGASEPSRCRRQTACWRCWPSLACAAPC